MIVHQDERVDLDAESPGQLLQSPGKRAAILVGQEDSFQPVTAVHDVIPRARDADEIGRAHV